MDYRSEKGQAKVRSWKKKRDIYYLALILWIIILPQDGMISVPIALLSFAIISFLERRAGLV